MRNSDYLLFLQFEDVLVTILDMCLEIGFQGI